MEVPRVDRDVARVGTVDEDGELRAGVSHSPGRGTRSVVMSTTTSPAVRDRAVREGDRHRSKAAIAGLAARGVLYLLLGILACRLTVGASSEQVDSRGALHELAGSTWGSMLLVLLAIGFAGFALLNVFDALTAGEPDDSHAKRRLADVGRAALYVALTVSTVGVLVSGSSGRSSDEKSQTGTAEVLGWPGGRYIVGAVAIAVMAAGIVMIAKVLLGRPHDQTSIEEAAPRQPGWIEKLGAAGFVARGAIALAIGAFLVAAAVDYDPNDAVGVDGALKRMLEHAWGDLLVLAIAVGLAAYGVYSLARAWANRSAAT
jgi:Domain of Unknown Function (DUF1206)